MDIRKLVRSILSENYPAGAEHDPNAPWNRAEPRHSDGVTPSVKEFAVIALYKSELAILVDGSGSKYSFYFGHLGKSDFEPYAQRKIINTEKGEDGPEHDYSDDWEIDKHVVENYVNDNLGHMTRGEGIAAFENGIDIVKIDAPLQAEILKTFGNSPEVQAALA